MKMQSGNAGEILTFEIASTDSEPGARCTGIIDRHIRFGVFRIHAQTEFDPFPRRFPESLEALPLGKRIEDNVIADGKQFRQILFRIRCGKCVDFSGKKFASKTCLMRRTGAGAFQHRCQQRINSEHRKGLLCQKDLCAGPPLNIVENCQIPPDQFQIDDEAGRFNLIQRKHRHQKNVSVHGSP